MAAFGNLIREEYNQRG